MGLWEWQRRWNRSAIKAMAPLYALFGLCVLGFAAPDAIRRGAVTEGVLLGAGLALVGAVVTGRLVLAGVRRRRSEGR
jgi:hypothetical protein